MANDCNSPATISASRGGSSKPERNSFGENEDQQRAMAVRDLGRAPDIFDDAEEVGRLNDDGRGLIVDFLF